ncbi:histone-lysine N-methyltransferase SMYD3 [Cimex lectularius]|uniref:MYND-type domain-containing protein n=1 Tax=Cimex lectularius TaxID=79782 RepID=A0A8I6RTL6_CIMLE|nr:histone-lysine N-methyltransferase SMYD3 [Cimex lectularius]
MKGVTMKKGSLIHSEKPFVHVLSTNHRKDRCDNCYSGCELLRCSGCEYVKYCDSTCQKNSWTFHRNECLNLKKLPPNRELPNAARLLARIIMKLKRGGGHEKGFYSKNRFRMFKDLMSHYSDIKEDKKKMEHSNCLYHVLSDFMGRENLPNFPEFVGLYGRVTVNSFNVLDLDMTTLGTAVYLGASTIDHSCEPNAVATFVGTTIHIRTVADIEDYDWSKVRISYIDTLKNRAERHLALWSQYYFECDCTKCNLKNDQRVVESCIQCQDCSAPVNVDKENVSCTMCGCKVPEETVLLYKEVINFTTHQYELMDQIAYFDSCKLCLAKMEGLVHHNNIIYVQTLDLAFESAIQLQKWDEAIELGQKLTNGYKLYCGRYSPLLGYHYLKYGKILLYNNNTTQALEMFEAASDVLKVTHGTEHTLYKHNLMHLMLETKTLLYSMS